MPEKKVRKPRKKPTIKKTGQKQKQTVRVVVNVGGKDSEKQPPRPSGAQLTMYAPPISIFTRDNPPAGFREPETTAPVYTMPSKPKSTAMPFAVPARANANFSPEESSVSQQERIVDKYTDDPIDINAGLPEDKYARINDKMKGLFAEFNAQPFLPFQSEEPMRNMSSEFISQPADTGIASMYQTPARRPIPPEKIAFKEQMINRRKRTPTSVSEGFTKPKTL